MRINRLLLVLLLASTSWSGAGAASTANGGMQASILTVRPDHPISEPDARVPLVEPHLAIADEDPSRLLAGAIRVSPDRSVWTCETRFSKDRGSTWRASELDVERCIDPWAAITATGAGLLAVIELGPADATTFRLLVHRAEDLDVRWNDRPTDLGEGYEHPQLLAADDGTIWLAVRHMIGSPDDRDHRMELFRSEDDGRSFESLTSWALPGSRINVTGLVELADGAIGIGIQTSRFEDDEAPLRSRAPIGTGLLRWSPAGLDEPIWFDAGCGYADTFAGYPSLTAGEEGSLLVHGCTGARLDGVFVAVSRDGGASWEAPVRVDGAAAGEGHALTVMPAIGPSGAIAVAWYDRSEDPTRACQRLLVTGSADRGRSWAPPVPVSREPSCPDNEANGSVASSWAMGGDYSSLVSSPDGDFHVLWADARGGPFALRHAALMVSAPPVP